MENLKNFIQTYDRYVWCAGFIIGGFILVQILKTTLFKKLYKSLASHSETAQEVLIPVLKKKIPVLLYVIILYTSIYPFIKNTILNKVFVTLTIAVTIYLLARIISGFTSFVFANYDKKYADDSGKKMAMHWISKLIQALIWIFAVGLFLKNIGVEIGALFAGLGIGGIAIAFAAQAILEDIFSYFIIFFDRPFELGDFIIAGDYMGTVEYIGVRTTRLKSISGEQLVFPNKDLTNARVKNYKNMEERRILFHLGVTYDTPQEKIRQIPNWIKEIIKNEENVRFDRAHFSSFADSSLLFEIVYYVLSGDYTVYMDIQQEINLKIRECFEKNKIEFAFPSRTLYIQQGYEEVVK